LIVDDAFWQGKRVLVTGADGFMGSHLTEKLVELGASVTALVRATSHSGTIHYRLKNIEHIAHRLKAIIGANLGDDDVVRLITANNPQIILHLAAIAYVPYSFEHPREVNSSNVMGTLNVLDASRVLPALERVVITSSSEVYGTALTEAIDETHPLNPTSPYAASKVATDRYAYSYWKTYGLPVAIIRPFNTYGPRHVYDVVPKFIRMVLEGKAPTIHGTGTQSRDLTYVDDTVNAFLTMGSHPAAVGDVFNFGTGIDVTVRDLANKIIAITGSNLEPIYVAERAAEVQKLRCDATKARRLLGWEPSVSIDEGLRRNIEWCKAHWF
jgi:nucleoside-diphosphate-sugar epimerase